MSDQKRFDEWTPVDCNDCELWWINRCDGVQKGKEKVCKSFMAVRRVDIPQQIKTLKSELFWLKFLMCVLMAVVGLLLLGYAPI